MNRENIVWRAELYSLYVQIMWSTLETITDCFSVWFLEKKQKSEVLFQQLCKDQDQCMQSTLPWRLLLLSCQYTSAIYPLPEKTQCKSSSYVSLNRKEHGECNEEMVWNVSLGSSRQFTWTTISNLLLSFKLFHTGSQAVLHLDNLSPPTTIPSLTTRLQFPQSLSISKFHCFLLEISNLE